jgi:hypothetical protein
MLVIQELQMRLVQVVQDIQVVVLVAEHLPQGLLLLVQVALLVVPETQVQQDQLEALVRPVQQEQMDLRDILSVATQQ